MPITITEFLEAFPIPLHHINPHSDGNTWVFWSQNEGSENSSCSSSDDLDTRLILDKFKSAFSSKRILWWVFLGQFWVPLTIRGRRLLSTAGQPFIVSVLSRYLADLRLCSEKYQYNIDVNKVDVEGDPMMLSGGPATAFLNRLPYIHQLQRIPSKSHLDLISVSLPICLPSQNEYCIGVLEFIVDVMFYDISGFVIEVIEVVKEAGLDVFYVQDVIPYKTIKGLTHAKEEIEVALKVVCESHNLAVAQVWIACEDKSHVHLSSSLEETKTKPLLAIKLTGYLYDARKHYDLDLYIRLCDLTPCGSRGELPLETLQDYESRYISKLTSDMLDYKVDIQLWPEVESSDGGDHDFFSKSSAFTICLRSNDTGDLDYVFEFIWAKHLYYVNFLEALVFTLKRCLPRFKFASGVELGDELVVIVGEGAIHSDMGVIRDIVEIEKIKIFQGKRSSPPMSKALIEGTKPMLVNSAACSEVRCKTTPKVLSREAIEKQFGKTMKEAAKNNKVSLSTFKRKFKELGIPEWPGPNYMKRNVNDPSTIQIISEEEDNEAIQDPSIINLNKLTLTLKVAHGVDMIKFSLPISQATFQNVEKEIGMKLKMSVGTYKLQYLDEDKDWISLRCDEEMSDCLKSSRKQDQILVRLRVLPSPTSISYPSGSFDIFSTL